MYVSLTDRWSNHFLCIVTVSFLYSLVKTRTPTIYNNMIIFITTLATILLVTKLGAKPKQQPKRVRVKAKRDNSELKPFKLSLLND